MTSAILLYYSISNTTLRVAERIGRGLSAEGLDVRLHSLRDDPAPDLAGADVVGFGAPTHYFRLAAPAADALRRIGPLAGRMSFSFVTYGTCRGDALNIARRSLLARGATELGAIAIPGEDLYLPYLRKGYRFSPGRPADADLDRAEETGRRLARASAIVSAGGPPPPAPPMDPPPHPVHRLERLLLAPPLATGLYSRFFRADASACTRCGRCARRCPTGNVTFTKGELPRWERRCILCLTCAYVCPSDAVRCPADWAVFAPFIAFNVRRAAGDPAIGHDAVVHHAGHTTVVNEDREGGGPDAETDD